MTHLPALQGQEALQVGSGSHPHPTPAHSSTEAAAMAEGCCHTSSPRSHHGRPVSSLAALWSPHPNLRT